MLHEVSVRYLYLLKRLCGSGRILPSKNTLNLRMTSLTDRTSTAQDIISFIDTK